MVTLLLTLLFFLLSFYGLSRFLTLPPARTPLFFFTLLSSTLFLGAMAGLLKESAHVMLILLPGLGLFILTRDLYQRKIDQHALTLFLIFACISLCLFFYTHRMTLSVIDEHVYWAIMSKSLYLNNTWPTESTTILERHLRYTPGTSLIHYFFFQIFQHYDESIAYFAHSLTLIACIFALIQIRTLQKTAALACLLLILLHLQYGSILARLDVDALLSLTLFTWVALKLDEREPPSTLYSLLILLFLSLIKEIGLYFSMMLLLFELLQNPNRKTLYSVFLSVFVIIIFHMLWSHYCSTQNFPSFAKERALSLILQDFNPFYAPSKTALFIFIRDLLLAPIDRLGTPGIVWFGIVGTMGFLLFKKNFHLSLIHTSIPLVRRRFKNLCIIFGIYLILLYELQVSTFHLGQFLQGHLIDTVISPRRYFNLGFSPIVLLVLYIFLAHHFQERRGHRFYMRIWLLSLAFIVYSYHHRITVDNEYALGKAISDALHQQNLIASGSHLCIAAQKTASIESKMLNDQLSLQLRHYLLDLNIAAEIEHPFYPCHYLITISHQDWTLQPIISEGIHEF